MHFAIFLSSGFTTMAVLNQPEMKLTKRTSVDWIEYKAAFGSLLKIGSSRPFSWCEICNSIGLIHKFYVCAFAKIRDLISLLLPKLCAKLGEA